MSSRVARLSSARPGAVRAQGWPEWIAVGLFGLLVGLSVHGQYDKPHGDFHDFRELGRELLAGETPHSFKRAPVFPVLVAGVGSALELWPSERPADQRAAELINALLLPLNALLIFAIAADWLGGGARWAAAWFILLPLGLYSTAHTLVEPLLVTTTLLTLRAARGPGWAAYAWAAAATMTRYDLAGLMPGLVLADLLTRTPLRRVVVRALCATTPLAVWLGLTALTWKTHGAEHYVAQLIERPGFDLGWAWSTAWRSTWVGDDVRLPLILADLRAPLFAVLEAVLALALLVGALDGGLRRDRTTLTLLTALLGYLLVHAVFPFREERFGYPPSVFMILLAGAGGAALARLARGERAPLAVSSAPAAPRESTGPTARPVSDSGSFALILSWIATACVAGLALAVIASEAAGIRSILALRPGWNFVAPWACSGGVALLAGAALWENRKAARRILSAGLVLLAVSLVQTRAVLPTLGSGSEMHNSVLAARFIRDNVGTDERVVSNSPGLLRLYAGRKPMDRFLGFDEVRSDRWDDILRECRERSITHIIWHDELFGEHGGYYTERWRLRRFECLADPQTALGFTVAREFPGHPRLRIYRLAKGASQPSGGE